MAQVGQSPIDAVDEMLESARRVQRMLEILERSAAVKDAEENIREARRVLSRARSAMERIR